MKTKSDGKFNMIVRNRNLCLSFGDTLSEKNKSAADKSNGKIINFIYIMLQISMMDDLIKKIII